MMNSGPSIKQPIKASMSIVFSEEEEPEAAVGRMQEEKGREEEEKKEATEEMPQAILILCLF